MTPQETQRLRFLTSGPVLKTLPGCRKRCQAITLKDLALLLNHFDCPLEQIHRKIHRPQIKRKSPDSCNKTPCQKRLS